MVLMTRINLTHPSNLTYEHLIGEHKEILRMPGYLNKSLSRKSKPFDPSEIPTQFKLGPGHVKFFYDKMKYIDLRFQSIVAEMERRGYTSNWKGTDIFKNVPPEYYNDWAPTEDDIKISNLRIQERLNK